MVVDGSPIVIKHGVLANSPFIQFNRLFPVDTQHMYIYINYIYIYIDMPTCYGDLPGPCLLTGG